MDIPFSQYLQEMATDGTHGNNLTLCTSSSTYNVDITLVSSLERKDHLEMNPTEFPSFGRIVLVTFVKDMENMTLVQMKNGKGTKTDHQHHQAMKKLKLMQKPL